jgi:hypothetical protein
VGSLFRTSAGSCFRSGSNPTRVGRLGAYVVHLFRSVTPMQCPRCGLQNPPGITACQRCALPVIQGPPAGSTPGTSPASGQPSPYGQPSPSGQPSGYGQAPPYGPPGYHPTGYPPSPPTQPYPQYAQQGGKSSYPTAYGTTATSPYGASPAWPDATTTNGGSTRRGAGLSRLVLLVGALASIGYAVWAFTARRGIFADFADNKTVSLSHARSSDRTDTILLIVAGGLAVLALAVWLIRLLSGRARAGALTGLGFVVSLAGMVCVVVGLVMSGTVDGGTNQVDEGQRAVTSTVVTGSGFIALAVGLLIGLLVVARRRDKTDKTAQPDTTPPLGTTTAAAPW